jgi:hypothetical protein
MHPFRSAIESSQTDGRARARSAALALADAMNAEVLAVGRELEGSPT